MWEELIRISAKNNKSLNQPVSIEGFLLKNKLLLRQKNTAIQFEFQIPSDQDRDPNDLRDWMLATACQWAIHQNL